MVALTSIAAVATAAMVGAGLSLAGKQSTVTHVLVSGDESDSSPEIGATIKIDLSLPDAGTRARTVERIAG